MKILFVLLFLCSIGTKSAWAQGGVNLSWQADHTEVYLHTVDVGPSFAELYGHVQIRLREDRRAGDYMVSWGLFDYMAPNFALNFYKGRLIYSVGIFDTRRALATYRYDDRTVWESAVYFTLEQKRRLLEKIRHDLKPENRRYLYNYFWDNCSTRPRDFLDYALGGALKKSVKRRLSADTWRDVVRRHQSIVPLSALALEVLMNSNLDRRMSLWDEMFLPHKLREAMASLPRFDDDLEPIAGSKLLTEADTFYEGQKYSFHPYRDYYLFAAYFLTSLFLVTVARRYHPKLGRKLLGVFLFLWFAVAGAFGMLMPTSWLFSNHLDLHHNVNMLLFWPIDWLFLYPSWCLLRGRNLPSGLAGRVYKWMLYAHFLLVGIMFLLSALGLVDQNIKRVLLTFGVASAIYWWILLRHLRGVALD